VITGPYSAVSRELKPGATIRTEQGNGDGGSESIASSQ